MNAAAQTIEAMRNHARTQDTETLLGALIVIGGTHNIPAEAKAARAVMLDVIEEREGEEFVDATLEMLGM